MEININGESHNNLCIGIDLGTTNSVLSQINLKPNGDIVSRVIGIDRVTAMYNAGGRTRTKMKRDNILPSCVYYNEENNFTPIVGDFAKGIYVTRSYLVAKSIKSQMGNATVEGLSPNVPDKTPAEVSARILEALLNGAKQVFRQNIEDAVITVPANFDSIMCQATLKAAEIAGLKIRNADGTLRSVLLPEPQAVIYDFINQVHNGDISHDILDLSTAKNVMVFDLGGGTLDVTLHKISRRKDAPDVLAVEDLGINRYTLLGGDDFDFALARKMFSNYLENYRQNPDVVLKIKREESAVMSVLISQAEELKIKLSIDNSTEYGSASDDAWGDDDDEGYPVGGHISATGFAYDDKFSAQMLEEIWRPFMGDEIKFNDFKDIDAVAQKYGTRNIIFPILDVLNKAADKLGTDNFKIDAVIMNGGMSRFYMVTNRLKEFFGFEPIVALDPDQSVARGAAVYHYFLHKYDERISLQPNIQMSLKGKPNVKTSVKPYIDPVRTILPDSLYLVTKDNKYEEIIKTGTALPHQSRQFTGFKLSPGTDKFILPIARKNLDNSYSVIAKGTMQFPEKYALSAANNYIAFSVSMNEQRIIRMDASICADVDGLKERDKGTVEISVASINDKVTEKSDLQTKNDLTLPTLSDDYIKNPAQLLNNIINYSRAFEHAQKHADHKNASKYASHIRGEKQRILRATNPEDFAEPFLQIFGNNTNTNNETLKMHFIVIGRKIGTAWTDSQKRRLASYCLQQIDSELSFSALPLHGSAINTKNQAIYALYMCGNDDDLKLLSKLHSYDKFHLALLYTHAMTKTDVDWIYSEFKKDCDIATKGYIKSRLQNTVHALGISYRLSDPRPTKASVNKNQIIDELCKILKSKKLDDVEMRNCFLAMGLLCDQRYENNVPQKILDEVKKLIDDIDRIYDYNFVDRFRNSIIVAQKMIDGIKLSETEEDFLLIKIADN